MVGGHVWGGMNGGRVCVVGGIHGSRMHSGVVVGGHVCMAGETAAAADGTHPCWNTFLFKFVYGFLESQERLFNFVGKFR